MKSPSLLLLLLLLALSCLPSMAHGQSAAALPPAGPNRPAGVPADYVITPFGYFHPSCVMQVNKGEQIDNLGVLHRADGSKTQVGPCKYPHFAPSGAPGRSAGEANKNGVEQFQEPAVEPTISYGWIENSNTVTNSSYGKEVSTWIVPPVPVMHDAQTIYFFPGFEDINNVQSILQPVLGSGAYNGYQWTMASWNCCLSGIAVESNPVNANAGDTIVGTTVMTCPAGTTNCATWNVTTEDQTTNQSTELSATPADGQTFNWGFGGVLEIYNVVQCLDYPPNGSLVMTSLLYDTNLNQVSNPIWTDSVNLPSTAQPQCNYGVTTTPTKTTLTFGTGEPGFGLSVIPIAGIAVNQGSSASGGITITGANGFTGSVDIAISNLPTGVKAELTQGTSSNTYTLTLTADASAALTAANQPAVMTITGSGSGVPTQTFPVNVIVNPPLTGGTGTPVNLTSAYNVYAFFDDSNLWPALNSTDSLDNAGDAYSANQLNPPALTPMDLNLNGVQFTFGTPNVENAVYGTGANPISLPNIQSPKLQILATGFDGSQQSQTITVTYSDNTTQTFTQTFDDWSSGASCTTSNPCALGESVALTMPYIDTMYSYPRIDSIFYLYEYSFALNAAKTVKSLTLPNNRKVVVLAATLSTVAPPPPTALQFIPVHPLPYRGYAVADRSLRRSGDGHGRHSFL